MSTAEPKQISESIGFCANAVGLRGEFNPPGDKSISHRAVIFSMLASGVSEVHGFLRAEDTLATLSACKALGALVEDKDGVLYITGVGLRGLSRPMNGQLDMGNSGTAMRLLAGVLAAQSFDCELFGDESLSARPMGRIIQPLRQMGSNIQSNNDCPPLHILPSAGLQSLDYKSPVASAQVKSCLLLAGLCAGVEVRVTEPALSRDHSERMLSAQGADISTDGNTVQLFQTNDLQPLLMHIPADISSAAFAIVAALILPGSDIIVRNISINPTRGRLLDALKAMGGNIEIFNTTEQGGEAVADLHVSSSALSAIDVPPEWVPGMIDEFPILMIAASVADGITRVRGAAELRVKESDRIAVMATGLRTMGVAIDEYEDGFDLHGKQAFRFSDAVVDGCGDHRCAMSYLVAGLLSSGVVRVKGIAAIATSYPGFIADMQSMGVQVCAEEEGSVKLRPNIPVIAIDGPSGAGKGTIASMLAKRLGWHLLDSGALYRLLTLAAHQQGITEPENHIEELEELAVSLAIDFKPDHRGESRARLHGIDVSEAIRAPEISALASRVAAIPEVRKGLFHRQRAFLQAPGLVADGRDMGTVVFADAPLKIFLTAGAEERAKRRHKQLKDKGENVSISRLYRDIEERDERDRTRAVAPLRPAADSVVIDSTNMSIQEVLNKVLEIHQNTSVSI